MSENADTYLINVVRQLPNTNDGSFCRRAANFWVALWVERAQRNIEQDLSHVHVSQSVEKVRSHKFVLSELYSKTGKLQKCAVTKAMENSTWCISSMMDLFQIHNPRVQWDPVPKALREYVEGMKLYTGVYPGGLTIMLCMIASGRSASLSKLLQEPDIKQCFGDDWSNHTIDKLRYIILTRDNETKGCNMAEGSTSEVRRSSKLCNVNYGYHTDWIRDFMREFDTTEKIFESFAEYFKKLSSITGIGAFRAVHILLWIFIAYDAEIYVPDEMLYDLAGPNVKLMEKMCQYAGFSYKQLYKLVKEELPHMDPIEYEIRTCKVINFIFLLNMQKQPSLCYRSLKKKVLVKPERRMTKKQRIE